MPEVNFPSDWMPCSISDIAQVNPKKIDAEPDTVSGFVPMSLAPVSFSDSFRYEEKYWKEINKSYTNFQNGDVIFAKVTPCFENGKSAIVDGLPNGIGAGSSEFYVLRPHTPYVLPEILFALIKTQKFANDGAANMTGAVGLRRVPRVFVESFDVPMIPIAEQKVIAEKLDTLLAQVETTKTRLENTLETLKQFRQSVLRAAVSGKLTEDWRVSNKCKLSDWEESSIGQLAEVATGKTPKRSNALYWNNGNIPWLTSSVTGDLYTRSAEQFVTELAVKECKLKVFPIGTLLLAMYGEGKTRGQVTEMKIAATCNQACAAILINSDKVSKEFIKIRLLENYEETRKAAEGGAQPNLNLSKVRDIAVSIPTIEEQVEIVSLVERLFGGADATEQQVNQALERVNNLTQSILAKAFRGELTEQWRKDNPDLISGDNSAEALLKKIKAEREAAKPKRKTTK
ncbi:TPA: restriction endonuclease subunit S [Vibrio parahaemolyticus]|uniref:restriction endonuclease subunit S n=1 Tax=Vibrio parahaemolyticus TaxID=670 RepID=UPI001A8DB1CE|nr:restriction endonuclease subunit S [Vibrio parahaemolyticus]MBO0156018.1 restriction endonuclease subunit S [Vibrio parahaemolyticus]MBO0171593.1 restriction endonuclease subunit S [Vibrio parahaemolyticus]MCX8857412.1 restriction endonuclease subunit S [Vibrio parahaemolyticus]MCX8861219.1 restriction endonuclease subunit S [Vibrio parahaemolyticus]MCX8867951.1 restriction endonuclease subunit S [Vibrio parahaemolyticus]